MQRTDTTVNRVIKFRGISKINGNLVYGDLLHLEKDFVKFQAIIDWSSPIVQHPIINGTACQFTGLIDKNRKEIYERDTLKGPNGVTGKIVWHFDGWQIEWINPSIHIINQNGVLSTKITTKKLKKMEVIENESVYERN